MRQAINISTIVLHLHSTLNLMLVQIMLTRIFAQKTNDARVQSINCVYQTLFSFSHLCCTKILLRLGGSQTLVDTQNSFLFQHVYILHSLVHDFRLIDQFEKSIVARFKHIGQRLTIARIDATNRMTHLFFIVEMRGEKSKHEKYK